MRRVKTKPAPASSWLSGWKPGGEAKVITTSVDGSKPKITYNKT